VGHRADGQVRPLDGFEPANQEHVVAVGAGAQLLGQYRRMVQRLCRHAVEPLQPARGVLRVGKHPAAFAEHLRVELDQPLAQADVGFVMLEVAVRSAAQLVGGTMLMDDPGDLARMACEVGREPGGDQQVDRPRVARRQVEHPPGGGLRQQLRLRLRPERQRHLLDLVAAAAQLFDQRGDVQLRPSLDERDLGVGHDDAPDGLGPAVERPAVRWQT
jgi:hypothetical protein